MSNHAAAAAAPGPVTGGAVGVGATTGGTSSPRRPSPIPRASNTPPPASSLGGGKGSGVRDSPRYTSSSHQHHHINTDLANAIRDSVVVNHSTRSSTYNPNNNNNHPSTTTSNTNNERFPTSQSTHSYLGEPVYHAPSHTGGIDFSASPTSPTFDRFPSSNSHAQSSATTAPPPLPQKQHSSGSIHSPGSTGAGPPAVSGAGPGAGAYRGVGVGISPQSASLMNNKTASGNTSPLRVRKVSSSNDNMASLAQQHPQPQLPSQRVVSAANPFEQDEIEPPPLPIGKSGRKVSAGPGNTAGVGAGGAAARARFVRAQTAISGTTSGTSPSSPTRTRVRRSMSSGSYGLDSNGRELTAGQRRAAEDKKGSKHADVIDRWDPTGLGEAMWHHSGPYDAAAPSRNVNLPNQRAPMRAFDPERERARAAAALQASSPRADSGGAAPSLPPKDSPEHQDGAGANAGAAGVGAGGGGGTGAGGHASGGGTAVGVGNERISKRAQAALRQTSKSGRRNTGGGLTGQYSTSVPASGGYFPDMDEPDDEASMLRRERQAQRDQKRRALKAAWGIDTPEPFEDFGASPGEEEIELGDELYPVDSALSGTSMPGPRVRSPGLRVGLGPRTPPIRDDTSPVSEKGPGLPASGSMPAYGAGAGGAGAGAGGVKRTKSLMQKIKGMRDGQRAPHRSHSPPIIESSDANVENMPVHSKRNTFFHRNSGKISPQKTSPLGFVLPEDQARVEEDDIPEEAGIIPSESTGSGFVLVESPNSKARAMKALAKERAAATSASNSRATSPIGPTGATGATNGTGTEPATSAENGVPTMHSEPLMSSRAGSNLHLKLPTSDTMASVNLHNPPPMDRVKGLPTPPIGPVIPDFEDLMISRTKSRSRAVSGAGAGVDEKLGVPDDGLKRKTSMVKKLKERIK